MEEQFILRVPPSIAERIERLLNEDPSSSSDTSLDLSFTEDGRSGTFMIGDEQFPASLLDLPCVTESYKSYDDNVLIKTADIGQMIMVREGNDNAPDTVEYRHGLTPPMRDARRRRFRREPDLNPEVVQRVENDLWNIMRSRDFVYLLSSDVALWLFFLDFSKRAETSIQDEDADENARTASKKPAAPTPIAKPDTADTPDPAKNAGEADGSDSYESDESNE